MPPREPWSLSPGGPDTGAAHLLQRTVLRSRNTGRLAPPAPHFAAAILPGAAAAVSIACPSPSFPGPGLSAGPGVAVGPHALVSPHSGASDRILKQLRKITHGDLAPKKKREKKKTLHEEGGRAGGSEGAGPPGGGVVRSRARRPPPAPGRGAGPGGGGKTPLFGAVRLALPLGLPRRGAWTPVPAVSRVALSSSP